VVKNKFKLPKTFLIILWLIAYCLPLTATVRYVSHDGSNTPPYLTWETAADSIMFAINISVFGDTIYVANGIYKERIDMTPGLTLIGAGMDSCIIDSRDFLFVNEFYSIQVVDDCNISNFSVFTQDIDHGNGILIESGVNSLTTNCKIQEAYNGIVIFSGNQNKPMISQNLILDVTDGITSVFAQSIISENIIYPNEDGLVSQINSSPTYINNTIVFVDVNGSIGFRDFQSDSKLKNNLFYGQGSYGIWTYGDSLVNNTIYGQNGSWGVGIIGAGSDIRNNNVQNTGTGLFYDTGGGSPPVFKYNNLWNNQTNFQNFSSDSTNIFSNPMFVNPDSLDFHLQMYSPLIDAGDPNILDVDGSRSDIGLWGGPYGGRYTYRDLAPKPPSNLTAVYDSGFVLLRWNKNTEADFYRYRVYRDTVPNFIYDTTKIIAVVADTFYYDDLPEKYLQTDYYYKLTAMDSTGHQSAASEEVRVIITGAPEGPPIVVEQYKLLQNYPNPFNPSTIIPYRLIEPGYVKLYVYDIKGEMVRILVNEYQTTGYYEVEFRPNSSERGKGNLGLDWATGYNDDIASGIYIYQIMVKSDRNIPVFTGMNKMLMIK